MNTAKKQRQGIAIIIAMIFMIAFMTVSTTIAKKAARGREEMQNAHLSRQAQYNADSAMRRALALYNRVEEWKSLGKNFTLTGESIADSETDKMKAQWKILNVSGDQGKLSAKIGDWNVYPFSGTGDAGKNCDVYDPVTPEKASAYQKEAADNNVVAAADFSNPTDYPCNWNKIRSFDGSVEIPLYAMAPDGTKVWLKFDEILIRVRTACNESEFTQSGTTNATTDTAAEKKPYDETGMCEKERRYGMMVDAKDLSEITQKEYIKNTVLNWGVYPGDGGSNWLIPIKEGAQTKNSNIHTLAINKANGKCFPTCVQQGPPDKPAENPMDFVVLDGNTMGQTGFQMLDDKNIKNVLNKPSTSDSTKPQISNPILRFTVEQKFLDAETKYSPTQPKYIPHLEYQILYKINSLTQVPSGMDLSKFQISGKPVIIGEGYSGGFKHTIRAYIIETKTGFDYLYQKP